MPSACGIKNMSDGFPIGLRAFPSAGGPARQHEPVCGNGQSDFLRVDAAAVGLHDRAEHIGEYRGLQAGSVGIY